MPFDQHTEHGHITLTLSQHNSDEENAQMYAWHEYQETPPGAAVRFDLRRTPEIADRIKELLQIQYRWTMEIDRGHLFYVRKPKANAVTPN